jgi:hypothetical protein
MTMRSKAISISSPGGRPKSANRQSANRLIDDRLLLARKRTLARFIDQAPGEGHAAALSRPRSGARPRHRAIGWPQTELVRISGHHANKP